MLQRGEDCIIGFAQEGVRGTHADAQVWVPARTPTGIAPMIESVDIKEGRGNKVATTGREIIQKRAEGDLEMNVRVQSFGHIAKSFFGAVASASKGGGDAAVYDHTFSILADNPEHPPLSGSLSQPAGQDYDYSLGLTRKLDFSIDPADLVRCVGGFIFAKEVPNGGAAYVPSFDSNDVYFRHQDVEVKLAANVAGLTGATPIKVKAINPSLDNGGGVNQNVSELNPGNILVGEFALGGSFELDYQNEDLHDAFEDNSYQALQITMTRSDITIGATANPKIVLTFPKISINGWSPNRPISELVTESIDFTAHNDATEGAVKMIITNLIANYNAA